MALFKSIWDDLRYSLRAGSMVTKLIVVNFSIFISVMLAFLVLWIIAGANSDKANFWLYEGLNWLCMPASGWQFLIQPWSVITSLFLHASPLHFLGNAVCLYLFGTIVSDLVGNRRILPLYLLAGLFGNFLFFMAAQVFPTIVGNDHANAFALGASGAIMGMGGAALIMAPDYRVMLFLLGEVKVKYIVLVMLVLDLVSIANNINTGGHAAHLGGFFFGCFFVVQLRAGRDLAEPVNRAIDWASSLFSRSTRKAPKPRRKAQMVVKGPFSGKNNAGTGNSDLLPFQQRLDYILDKIKAQGYQNLTEEEKDFLHKASKK